MVITATYILVLIITLILVGLVAMVDSNFFAKKMGAKMLLAARNSLLLLLVVAIIYLCYLNFPITLTLIVFITGIIAGIDLLFFAKKRRAHKQQAGTLVTNAREFFPILALVWVIRSFIIQPYHVPTGSLEPTILPGDFIAVKQYSYGLRFPIGNFTIIKTGEPKTGDIALFYLPTDPGMILIKRVIGMPGDHIVYKNKVLTINGVKAKQQLVGMSQDTEPGQDPVTVERLSENLSGIQHEIFIQPAGGETQDFDTTVPTNMYFMMGDNRDDSDDSRFWGFVPEQNLIGKAFGIWMNWDATAHRVRWDRIGHSIH